MNRKYLISRQTPIAYQTLAQGKVELSAKVSETPDTYTIYVVEKQPTILRHVK